MVEGSAQEEPPVHQNGSSLKGCLADQRGRRIGCTGPIAPRHLESAYGGPINLRLRGITHPARIVTVGGPVGFGVYLNGTAKPEHGGDYENRNGRSSPGDVPHAGNNSG